MLTCSGVGSLDGCLRDIHRHLFATGLTWGNVDVQPEDVGRVVAVLQADEPRPSILVSRLDAHRSLIGKERGVRPAVAVDPQSLPALMRPSNVLRAVWILRRPHCDQPELEADLALPKGGGV
jgi:hypothetical protein